MKTPPEYRQFTQEQLAKTFVYDGVDNIVYNMKWSNLREATKQ